MSMRRLSLLCKDCHTPHENFSHRGRCGTCQNLYVAAVVRFTKFLHDGGHVFGRDADHSDRKAWFEKHSSEPAKVTA